MNEQPSTLSPPRPAVPLPVLSYAAGAARGVGAWARVRPCWLRLYRLGVVVAIVWIVHRHRVRLRVDEDAPISLQEAQTFFPAAGRLEADESEKLGLNVYDAGNRRVGYVLRTAPISNGITGFVGPTDTLVAMDAAGRVVGVRIRHSDDTKEHVGNVAADEYFLKTWTGKTWDEVAGMDPKTAGIEGVSGASLTSLCIANGIRHRFQFSRDAAATLPAMKVAGRDWGLIAALVVGAVFCFTRLRSRTWARRLFQAGLVGYVGFWNGQLLAQSLFAGWAASTVPWRIAPGLVLLAAAALVVPWGTRRALYCSHVCPHGAAQEWIGRAAHRWVGTTVRLPSGVERGLRGLPALLVGLVLVVVMLNVPFDLAGIEPFDAYLIRTAGVATVVVAVVGLLAAAAVPMAYCKYGCPTGLLLGFVRSHGKADRFGRRDWAAGAMVLFAAGLLWQYETLHRWIVG